MSAGSSARDPALGKVSDIYLTDMLGRRISIIPQQIGAYKWAFDVSTLSAGTYYVVYMVNEKVKAIMLSVQK